MIDTFLKNSYSDVLLTLRRRLAGPAAGRIQLLSGPRQVWGLLEFCSFNRDHRPLVICDPGMEGIARAAGVEARTWHHFLTEGPPP